MFNGKLAPFLADSDGAAALAYALKIVINIVYGLTSAKFDNPFRDPRNVDNIVAKRGALFMIELKREVQAQGFTVAHIKTDSIKIPYATPEIIDFVMKFGEKYGYEFEHEATYNKMVLVNDAVYIAQELPEDAEYLDQPVPKGKVHWTAVGAQFQNPYVFKMLFSDEQVEFADMKQPRSVVKGAMYLDPNVDREALVLPEHLSELQFVGRTGEFIPVAKTTPGAGKLYRIFEDKSYAVAGTKGHYWMLAEIAAGLELENYLDEDYYNEMLEQAKMAVEKYTGYLAFIEPNRIGAPPF